MSLKEKAKTAEQIYDEIDEFYITSVYDRTKGMTYREFVKLKEAKWVRLEDAEQAIAELKQKLRQFAKFQIVMVGIYVVKQDKRQQMKNGKG